MDNKLPYSTEPSLYRNGKNVGAAPITGGRLLKYSGSGLYGCDVATTATDKPYGVSEEPLAVGQVRSVKRHGFAQVIAGGAVNRGDKVTADGTGRGIATTTASNTVWGVAETPAGQAGDVFTIELFIGGII